MTDPDGPRVHPDGALVDLVTGLLGAVRRWAPLGTGLDHHAWQADTDEASWVIRQPTATGGASGDAGPEVRLTGAARAAGLRWVPELRELPPLPGQPAGVTAHRLVPGRPLLDVLAERIDGPPLSERDLVRIGRQLGGFVAALGGLTADALDLPVDVPDAAEWLASTAAAFDDARSALDPDQRAAVERFLAAPPPRFPDAGHLVVAHHDLGAEHVLVDRSLAVTGIIDWTDAAVTDPAADLGRVLRDLGDAAFRSAAIAWTTPVNSNIGREMSLGDISRPNGAGAAGSGWFGQPAAGPGPLVREVPRDRGPRLRPGPSTGHRAVCRPPGAAPVRTARALT